MRKVKGIFKFYEIMPQIFSKKIPLQTISSEISQMFYTGFLWNTRRCNLLLALLNKKCIKNKFANSLITVQQ